MLLKKAKKQREERKQWATLCTLKVLSNSRDKGWKRYVEDRSFDLMFRTFGASPSAAFKVFPQSSRRLFSSAEQFRTCEEEESRMLIKNVVALLWM